MTMLSARAIGPPPWVGPATLAAGASAGRATGADTEPAVSIPSRMACSMDAAGSEEGPTSGLGKKAEPATPHRRFRKGGRYRSGTERGEPADFPTKPLRDATHSKRPAPRGAGASG